MMPRPYSETSVTVRIHTKGLANGSILFVESLTDVREAIFTHRKGSPKAWFVDLEVEIYLPGEAAPDAKLSRWATQGKNLGKGRDLFA